MEMGKDTILFKFPPEEKKKLKAICKRLDMTVSQFVRRAIRQRMEEAQKIDNLHSHIVS